MLKKNLSIYLLTLSLPLLHLEAEDECYVQQTPQELPSLESAKQNNSLEFTKGYLSAKLEERFGSMPILFDVQCNKIIFYRWPTNLNCTDIKYYLENLNYSDIEFDTSYQPSPTDISTSELYENDTSVTNELLPELNPFFPTMLAKPHIVGYSAGYRTYDKVYKISVLPVSIGDQFSLYKLKKISYGNLYIGIEACVWAIFEAKAKSLALINADYYVAFPITYINERFSAKLSFYHQSSHLGDEYILENPKIERFNPSMEVVDLSVAYDFNDDLTVFAGYAHVLRSDEDFQVKPGGVYYGFNYHLDFFKVTICNLEAEPYLAAYFQNEENNNWKLDSSLAIGYQWNKPYGHKLRIYLEGHAGFSDEGQFAKERTRYLALKLLYGY